MRVGCALSSTSTQLCFVLPTPAATRWEPYSDAPSARYISPVPRQGSSPAPYSSSREFMRWCICAELRKERSHAGECVHRKEDSAYAERVGLGTGNHRQPVGTTCNGNHRRL